MEIDLLVFPLTKFESVQYPVLIATAGFFAINASRRPRLESRTTKSRGEARLGLKNRPLFSIVIMYISELLFLQMKERKRGREIRVRIFFFFFLAAYPISIVDIISGHPE